MKIRASLLILLLSPLFLFSQKIDVDLLKGIKTRSIGPAGMSGRVTSIDVDLQNTDRIFIGTASGGVWKSESGGITWEPIFDKEKVQSIGAIAINQNNPSEIWVGTGEGNPRNSHNSGLGIYRSIDGGKSWTHMGLDKTRLIHRIIIHRDNPDIVYVAALGSAWGPNPERGVFKTVDGGKTWKKILYVNEGTGAADLVVDPSNPNKLIAAMWEFGRKPWTFNSGGEGSGLYRSYDGGENWTEITGEDGLPKATLGRIGLAIAPSKPNTIYALVEADEFALYRSTDGGHKWSKRSSDKNIGNRPFYYADIFVDPQNENRIYSLWSVVSRSEDGGKTFDVIVPYSGVHPDHHAFWIHPENPNYIIEGNDGGLNISKDGGDNWRFIENLPLAQFYHINYDMEIPYNVCGGMQDNGSWVGPSAVWKSGGIRNGDWQEVAFGDGFDVVPRPDDNRFGYAMSQGGYLSYYDRETGDNKFIRPVHPDGDFLRFNWNAAIAQNPFHNCGIYFGSQYVHKSLDCGKSWEIISPDLTTNDSTKQKQALSGGLTIDATQAENFTSLLAIAPSPLDEDIIWVSSDDGQLHLTRDGGKNWTNLSQGLVGCPKGSWIPQIELSAKNKGEAFVVVNNYRRNDWKPYVFHTKNFGESWTRIADENKVSGYAQAIVQDPEESRLLFLGTDHGLYFSIDAGTNWNKWNHDFPSVSTIDLKIHPREHDLIIGTFGRAAFILDDIRPFRELARSNGKTLDRPFKVFPAPNAYQASFASVDGMRFAADAAFKGKNKGRGGMLTLWVKKDEKKEKEEKAEASTSKKSKKKKKAKESPSEEVKKDKEEDKKEGKDKKLSKGKVKVQAFNTSGDTLYTFYEKLKPGMNRIQWNLRRKGTAFPSWRETTPESNDPWGPRVNPGTYKLVFIYGDHRDSTEVTVLADPRIPRSLQSIQAQDKAWEEYEGVVAKATEGFDRLKEAKKTISLVNQQLVNLPDSTQKTFKDLGLKMKDSIAVMMKIYTQPKDSKGIDSVTPTMNRALWQASSYLYDADGKPGQNAQHAIDHAKREVEQTLQKINHFFENGWMEYRKEVEAKPMVLFKDWEEIELD